MSVVNQNMLEECGVDPSTAVTLLPVIERALANADPKQRWERLKREVLKSQLPWKLHRTLYDLAFKDYDFSMLGPAPAWSPSLKEIETTNLGRMIKKKGLKDYSEFFNWSITNRYDFWSEAIDAVGIRTQSHWSSIADDSKGVEKIEWFPSAQLNIVDSCFKAPTNKIAIRSKREPRDPKLDHDSKILEITYGELEKKVNRIANTLVAQGFNKGDAIAIHLPMTIEAVAIYLAIIKAGMIIVSIADSFAPDEIQTRLNISKALGIFTQDQMVRGGKTIGLYDRAIKGLAPRAIVLTSDALPAHKESTLKLRPGDQWFNDILSENDRFSSVTCEPSESTNILFSSGTTGEPKAIPWTHTTPIKCAVDGFFHHDIKPDDVVTWPTNLGWMMGPWLIYATFINQATMAIFEGAPHTRTFGEFVQDMGVTILGLVPSIVKAWKNTGCMQGLNWKHIKCFSSTGECSNEDDYLYLMSLANYRPVIEYCGGTEIGGGYLTGTLLQPASPATFTTPTLGMDFEIKDGELFLIPPSIGLSQTLINKDHHEIYYKDCPLSASRAPMRRHGDEVEKLAGGYFRAHGRADDTMNLGGIKVSSVEIERAVALENSVHESAAIAINPVGGGPSLLVLFVVLKNRTNSNDLKMRLQKQISEHLNPLFKVHDIVIVDSLPRTASQKIMRRVLRAQYRI